MALRTGSIVTDDGESKRQISLLPPSKMCVTISNGDQFGDASKLERGPDSMPLSTSSSTCVSKLLEGVVRVRSFWWWALGAVLLVLPLSLAAGVFTSVRIGPIHIAGLFFWLELSWLTLWILYLVTWFIGSAWRRACQLLPLDIVDYQEFLYRLRVPLATFLWVIASWAMVPALCHFDNGDYIGGWVSSFETVLVALIVCAALFLFKCLIIEVIYTKSVVYFMSSRKKELKKSASAIKLLLHHPKGENHKKEDEEKSIHKLWDLCCKHPMMHRTHSEIERYLEGKGDQASYKAVRQKILISFNQDPDINLEDFSLTEGDIKERLRHQNKEAREGHHDQIKLSVDELMRSLGAAESKIVRYEDLTWLIQDIGKGLEMARKGENCIVKVVGHLDIILSIFTLGGMALIFAAFFVVNISQYLTPFWTVFTGLGFALGPTVQEYLAACTFVFSQHPYDVGDRIAYKDDQLLIVEDIYLAYTTFRCVDSRRVSQIRHIVLCKESIQNLTRSNIQYLTDSFHVESRVIPDLNAITEHLDGFVQNAKELHINRYFDHVIQIAPSEDEKEIKKLSVSLFYKPRCGAGYEALLSECRRRLKEELRSKLSEMASHADSNTPRFVSHWSEGPGTHSDSPSDSGSSVTKS